MSQEWHKINKARVARLQRRSHEQKSAEQHIIDHEYAHLEILGKGEFQKITNSKNEVIGGFVPLFDAVTPHELALQIKSAEMDGASELDLQMAKRLKGKI